MEIKVDYRLGEKISLKMKRYLHAAKMYYKYRKEEARAYVLKKKWQKKFNYYAKLFGENPDLF